ncbi:MAG: alanine racemase [Patescibacteria group bacterium]
MLKSFYNKYLSKLERRISTLNRVEVISENILHNFDFFQKENPHAKLFPVLKSNAYGHGLKEIVGILDSREVEYLVVDSYYEALQIKEVSDKKILMIGYTKPENYQYFKWKNLAITIFDLKSLKTIGELGKKINIHLFINTGMNREGIDPQDLPLYLAELKKYPAINVEGLGTHLADASAEVAGFTDKQVAVFKDALAVVEKAGFNPKYKHIAATGGAFKIKDPDFNAIRLGKGLYGYNPILPFDSRLRPAIRVISTIVSTQNLMPGDKVSYSCTFTAKEKMRIGIIPVGYNECLDRRLSNKGFILSNDRFLPIIGRVCMNLTGVDLRGMGLQIGDEVVVISDKSADKNSVENIARQIDTISYEVLTGINSSIRRVVI